MRATLVARRIAAYVLDVVLLALVLVPLAFGIQAVSGYTVSAPRPARRGRPHASRSSRLSEM